MFALRPLRVVALALLATVLVGTPSVALARTVGQAIDDATIATSVKTRLVADAFSNLMKVSVKANEGVVTLSGEVDSALRRDRAVQIAASVDGVKSVVDELRVTGVTPTAQVPAPPPVPTTTTTTTTTPGSSTVPASSTKDTHVPAASVDTRTTAPPVETRTPASSGSVSPVTVPGTVDVNGIVAHVDPRARTITLRDGRVVKMADGTVIWQPVPIASVQPGTQVSLRNVEPAGYQGPTATGQGDGWRMGTVSRVDTATSTIVLSDGTAIHVPPSTKIRINDADVPLERIEPGTEVVVRTPSRTATIDASDVEVVATPR